MGYRLDITLDELPRMNTADGIHWRTRQKERDRVFDLLRVEIGSAKPPGPLLSAHVTVTRHSSAQPDFENLTQGGKHIFDGLVRHGILRDDGPKDCTRTYLWQPAKKGHGHVTISVEET